MNNEGRKQCFGNDYPAAVERNGIRMPLAIETQFTRYFQAEEPNKGGYSVSRFMDGSASITSAELQRDWATWTNEQREDFCQASVWLHQRSDFLEMLRFIMEHGTSDQWSSIAHSISSQLPSGEAFSFLRHALRLTGYGKCSNITSAIATTKHPEAEMTLRKYLQAVWGHSAIWDDDDFTNWVAYDATTCIGHLIELGASPADFEDKVRKLSQHICLGNRTSCRTYLSKHYSWLIPE